jgi:hypothetical protein
VVLIRELLELTHFAAFSLPPKKTPSTVHVLHANKQPIRLNRAAYIIAPGVIVLHHCIILIPVTKLLFILIALILVLIVP